MAPSELDDAADAGEPGVEDVLALARTARLPMSAERAAELKEGLAFFLAFAEEWDSLGLAFSFEDGSFGYAPYLAQFRPAWDEPTKLNKGRVASGDPSTDEDRGK
jgi:hypothetical protein